MNPYKEISVLLPALINRRKEAYEFLYDEYSPGLYGVITRIIKDEAQAADILQDTFVNICQKIETYNPEKGSFFTWLLNIARNKAIDELRKKERKSKIHLDENIVSMDSFNSLTNNYEIKTDTIGLRSIVDDLKPDLREMIELHYFNGLTQQEITDLKEMPLGTVKTKLRQAMQHLKKIFEVK